MAAMGIPIYKHHQVSNTYQPYVSECPPDGVCKRMAGNVTRFTKSWLDCLALFDSAPFDSYKAMHATVIGSVFATLLAVVEVRQRKQ